VNTCEIFGAFWLAIGRRDRRSCITDEPIEMLFGGQTGVRPVLRNRRAFYAGCTLPAPGEYAGSVSAAATAVRSVATVTAAA